MQKGLGATAPGVIPQRKGRRGTPHGSTAFGPLLKGRDTFRLLLFFLTFISISRIHAHLGLGFLRPALLLAAGSLAYALMNPRVLNWNALFRYWPPKVIAALAVLACLSAAFGISLGAAARFILEDYSKTLVLAALLIAAFRGASDVRLIVAAYVIGAGVLVYFALFVFALTGAGSNAMRLSNLYTYDANDLGLMLLMAVPFALWLYGTERKRGKILIGGLLLGVGAAIALSGSRGAFVGAVALVAALLWFVRNVALSKRMAVVGVLGLGLVVMAPPGYWTQMLTMLEPTEDYNWNSPTGRRQVALRGLGYMMEYPVFGIGVGNFGRAEGMLSDIAMYRMADQGVRWTAAHNSYIQVGAELGIPGLILWTVLVFGGMIGMVRLRKRLPRSWARGDPEQRFLFNATMYLPAAYVAFAVPAFFLSFAYLVPIYLLSALYCGVHSAVSKRLRQERAVASAARSQVARFPGGTPVARPVGRPRLV